MRKLVVTCQCGQRMQVPRSAVGKTGLCPACGQSITINNDSAQAAPLRGARPLNNARQTWWQGRTAPSEDAKRKFGEAVDLYYSGKYGESLAIFDGLAKQYPGNPDIENGRAQCMRAMRQPPLAIEGRGGAGRDLSNAKLDAETIERVILEKMIHGANEATQLQAAELAARMLGLLNGRPNGRSHAETPEAPAAPPEQTPAPAAGDHAPQGDVILVPPAPEETTAKAEVVDTETDQP